MFSLTLTFLILISQLKNMILAVVMINMICKLICRFNLGSIDLFDHVFQLLGCHMAIVLYKQHLMDTAWENEEVTAHLLSCIFHEIRICDNTGSMNLIRNCSNKHLLIFRCDLRNHARRKLTHHFRHTSNLRWSDLWCILHGISTKLFLSYAVLIKQLIGNKDCPITGICLIKNKAINNRHILHSFMRYALKKFCILLRRYHFHGKLALHLLIIRKRLQIHLRRFTESFLHCISKMLSDLRDWCTILISSKCFLNTDVHSNGTVHRSYCNSIIAVIHLIYSTSSKFNISSSNSKFSL